MAKIECNAQHAVVGDEERELNEQGQTSAGGIYAFLLIEPADFLVHAGLARIAQAVFLVLLLNGLDLRLNALHLQHRLHLRDAQRQQQNRNDQSLKNNGPSPVGNDVVISPLQPQEERPSQNSPPTKVDDPAKVGIVVLDGWNMNRIEYRELFGTNVH